MRWWMSDGDLEFLREWSCDDERIESLCYDQWKSGFLGCAMSGWMSDGALGF